MDADPRVFGQLLLIQSTMHVMPDEPGLAQFVCAGLGKIEGFSEVRVCIEGRPTGASSILEPCGRSVCCRHGAEPTPEEPCRLAKGKNIRVIPIQSPSRNYGLLWVHFASEGLGDIYTPYLQNTGNLLALLIENRRKEKVLSDLNENLESLVAERTNELVKKEQDLNFVYSAVDDVAFVTTDLGGRDTRVLKFSPGAENIFGYSRAEIIGKRVAVLHPPEVVSGFDAMQDALRRGEKGHSGETTLIRKSGERFAALFTIHPRFDADGELVGTIGVSIDITDQKRAAEEKVDLQARLHESEKIEAIGQLAGGIAHDFNNILTAILGNAQLMKMDQTPGDKAAPLTEEIIKSASRAADLTRQLLVFARRDKRLVTIVDIHQSIDETISMLAHSIDRRIEIDIDQKASPATIAGDPSQIQNALLNLGLNARDAMPEGGRLTYRTSNVIVTDKECTFEGGEIKPGNYVEIRVTDTGVGMGQKIRARAFEPFFTTKEVGKGTGLGLASVYGCVRSHGGKISIDSEPGHGTTFSLLLPSNEIVATPGLQTSAQEQLPHGTGRILVVDDEKSVRNFASAALQSLGYVVTTCSDGLEAVDHYRRHYREIDLVILDLVMPKMNGQDAFDEIRAIDPRAKVLISSGFSHSDAIGRLLDQGAVALLNKPFQLTTLSQTVAQHISSAPAGQTQ
ncbi:MAG: response regulator [Phycisphaerae bacterium]|nr:response regulator [Phycisphaerae bacterium]